MTRVWSHVAVVPSFGTRRDDSERKVYLCHFFIDGLTQVLWKGT